MSGQKNTGEFTGARSANRNDQPKSEHTRKQLENHRSGTHHR